MTVVNPGDYETGLEDFGLEDAVIPRLSVVHKEAEFKDSLSNEQFEKVQVIILGLVEQRVLWHQTMDDGDWPMCRSANHEIGVPNLSDDQPREKRFPWDKSGFRPEDYPADEASGKIHLPCNGCQLKEWKSHPDGKKPYCTEQFTLPILYDPRGDGNWVPAITTFQKTGLKPLKSYLTSFARSKTAAYTAITEISLTPAKKGSTDYAIPEFRRVGDTEPESYRDYAVNFRTMRDFLVSEPEDEDSPGDAASAPKDDPWATPKDDKIVQGETVDVPETPSAPPEPTPPPKEEPKPEPTAAAPAPAPAAEDDDLPF